MKNVRVFLCAVTMLIFQIKRIISSEKCCNYIVTFFFLKMPKIWVGRTTVNGEKKRGWANIKKNKQANKTKQRKKRKKKRKV